MKEPVRVTVETDDDHETARVHEDDGSVTVDDVTFSFDVGEFRGEPADDDTTEADITEVDSTETDGSVGAATDGTFLTTLDDVPSETTMRFEALAGRRGVEGIVQRQGDSVIAWENSCPHEPDVRLDKGMGAFVAGGQFVCDNHGARFDVDDGFCTHGPCQGQSLRPIDVAVRDGKVYVTDDRFDDCRTLGMF